MEMMKTILVGKVLASSAIAAAAIYAAILIGNSFWPLAILFLLTLAGLVAVHSTRDRDYGKEPVTDPEAKIRMEEERRGTVQDLIAHLETDEHSSGGCDPCPIPALLKSLASPTTNSQQNALQGT